MIQLTKINNEIFYINPNLIEIIENTPDTMITTMSGKKYCVLESVDAVTAKVTNYYTLINTRKVKSKKE